MVSTTALSRPPPLPRRIDNTGYILWLNPQLFGPLVSISTKLLQLFHQFLGSFGILPLFLLGFPDQVHHPALVILLALKAIALINPDHFAKELAFGAALLLSDLGYFLFEIPGTILVESWSARTWFARIMVSWGFCAIACGFIHSREAFYTLRLLLGACEAGFAPGVVVYLTHWYLREQRGRAMALFLIGIPLAE